MSANIQPMFSVEWEPYIIHEVNGVEIKQRRNDSYIDVSAICCAGGKRYHDWRQNNGTDRYLAFVAETTRILVVDLIQSIEGRGGGTFAEKHVALAIAAWVSPEVQFYVFDWFLKTAIDGGQANLEGAGFETRRVIKTFQAAPPDPPPQPTPPITPAASEQIPWREMLAILTEVRKHQLEHSRGEFAPEVKRLARRTVLYKYRGRCPVSDELIVDEDGEIIVDEHGQPIAEYDHMHGSTDGSAGNCFLIARLVHQRLTGKKLTRSKVRPFFEVFQHRIAEQAADDEKQPSLFED